MENIKSRSAMRILTFFAVMLFSFQLTSCNGQKKDGITYPKEKIMNNERFDIEKHQRCLKTKLETKNFKHYPLCDNILNDGTIIYTSENTEDYQEESIPSAPNLLKKVKLYYLKTAIIKEEFEKYVGQFNEKIGTSKYYDEKGYLIKTVDENAKYEDLRIKILDLFEILKREPLLDVLSTEEKAHFNNIFSLGKEIKNVTLEDVFKYLKRDKILNPMNTDTTILDTEDRFRLEISFDQDKKKWHVIKELYPFGQISLEVDSNTGKVSNKEYKIETRP
jgi:hypothetical protein